MCRSCGLGAMKNGVPVLVVTGHSGDLRSTYKAGKDALFQLGCYSRNSIQEPTEREQLVPDCRETHRAPSSVVIAILHSNFIAKSRPSHIPLSLPNLYASVLLELYQKFMTVRKIHKISNIQSSSSVRLRKKLNVPFFIIYSV